MSWVWGSKICICHILFLVWIIWETFVPRAMFLSSARPSNQHNSNINNAIATYMNVHIALSQKNLHANKLTQTSSGFCFSQLYIVLFSYWPYFVLVKQSCKLHPHSFLSLQHNSPKEESTCWTCLIWTCLAAGMLSTNSIPLPNQNTTHITNHGWIKGWSEGIDPSLFQWNLSLFLKNSQ